MAPPRSPMNEITGRLLLLSALSRSIIWKSETMGHKGCTWAMGEDTSFTVNGASSLAWEIPSQSRVYSWERRRPHWVLHSQAFVTVHSYLKHLCVEGIVTPCRQTSQKIVLEFLTQLVWDFKQMLGWGVPIPSCVPLISPFLSFLGRIDADRSQVFTWPGPQYFDPHSKFILTCCFLFLVQECPPASNPALCVGRR